MALLTRQLDIVALATQATFCMVALCAFGTEATDADLYKHQNSHEFLEQTIGLHVTHSEGFPSNGFLRISTNPLRDEPNKSVRKAKRRHQNAIEGSRRALIVTKVDYLKKEWCKTEPVKQEIRKQGCVTKTIINRFCYGQCNSFFIPRRRGSDMEANAFKSCAFCRPKKTDYIFVTLNCPGRNIKRVRKKIPVIKSCNCMALDLD